MNIWKILEIEETTDLKDFFMILVVLFIRNMKV